MPAAEAVRGAQGAASARVWQGLTPAVGGVLLVAGWKADGVCFPNYGGQCGRGFASGFQGGYLSGSTCLGIVWLPLV